MKYKYGIAIAGVIVGVFFGYIGNSLLVDNKLQKVLMEKSGVEKKLTENVMKVREEKNRSIKNLEAELEKMQSEKTGLIAEKEELSRTIQAIQANLVRVQQDSSGADKMISGLLAEKTALETELANAKEVIRVTQELAEQATRQSRQLREELSRASTGNQ